MGDMSWLSHLVTNGSKKQLEDFLKDKGFRKPKFAAEQFLQAQMEIEENSKKKYDSVTETINNNVNEINNLIKSTPEYKIGKEILEGDIDVEPTTADKYNKEWLDEKGSES